MKKFYLSELFATLKTRKQFDAWVEKTATELKTSIYDARKEIHKKEVEDELRQFTSLKHTWDSVKPLIKKDKEYELLITIDNDGYHRFSFRFPITKSQYDRCVDYRKGVIKELNKDGFKWGSSCISIEEAVWTTLHEEIYRKFSFATFYESYHYIEAFAGQPLVRKLDIWYFRP